ncbi:MAG: transcription antiterminator NusG [Hyphomicrobiales bacterium]|nr:transcription antiterminator NusG [Hyphomicrobiales bacterium]MCP5002107.1 transcription antiterminator NusG [Hyphomicrobiales bacterium]
MGTNPVGHRWYVAATLPNRENLARQQLGNQGFKTFFPKRLKTIRHARKSMNRIVSFFPGYLFVSLDLKADRWRSVNGTIGVRSLIMGRESPLAAPNGVVEQLQQMTDKDGFLRLRDELKPGDQIRILNGPMADMVGELDRLDGKHRARVLLDMLHSKVHMVVPIENMSKQHRNGILTSEETGKRQSPLAS